VPPVCDEKSETQRKAHAQRVRQTRRPTQGVTLEEIKVAQQLVKKKNQQQLHQATQQLSNNEQSDDDLSSHSSHLSHVSSLAGDDVRANLAKDGSENGEVDYKQLYEKSLVENERLREKLKRTEDLNERKSQRDKLSVATAKIPLTELEKRERRAMVRKLSEMEEELKLLEQLKSETQRLKDTNGVLFQVISKLSK
jgi:hypothetical protein